MNDYPQTLRETGLTEGLSDAQIEVLCGLAQEQNIRKGTIIIHENARSRDMYIIRKGRVSIRMKIPSGDEPEEVLLMLNEKQVFGEISLVDGYPRSATVRAEDDVNLLCFTYEPLLELFDRDPRAGYLIMRNIAAILASRTRSTNLLWRNLMIW